jgi:II/X family phage/plasmid replication protein
MKSNPSIEIDTVNFSVIAQKETFNIPDATIANVISQDGVLLDSFQNRKSVSGKFGAHALNVRTLHCGSELKVEGSPFAYRYGQNLFTSSNIKLLVREALLEVCKIVDSKATEAQMKEWLAGDIELHRVDLAVNFRLESEAMCVSVLRQIRRQLEEQGGSTRSSGTTIYWIPKDGEEYTIVFYAKGPQMRRLKRYDRMPYKARLIAESANILRVEIRVAPLGLRNHSLNRLSVLAPTEN